MIASGSPGRARSSGPEVLDHLVKQGRVLTVSQPDEVTIPPPGQEETRSSKMDDQSSQFLDAFTAIEKHLRKIVKAEKHVPFSELVEKASKASRPVSRYREALKEFGDLRNFIVHEYRQGDPLAVPSPSTVERLGKIRDELLSPARLLSVCRREVEICAPGDLIGSAARKMYEGSFSQLPVYRGAKLVGLLAAETVARWLANKLAHGEGILEEETVEEVLQHAEDVHQHQLMGQDATVFDALSAFEDLIHSGKVLDAIILTFSGKKTESPVGIVTVSDLPRLNKLVTL
jgi:predicted transcriptional regulator